MSQPDTQFPVIWALALALVSLSIGLVSWSSVLPVSTAVPPIACDLDTAWKLSRPTIAGALLAILLGRRGNSWRRFGTSGRLAAAIGPVRTAALAAGSLTERADAVLRGWPEAAFALLVLTILFGAAMLSAGGLP